MATVIPRIPADYHGSPGEREAILALRHLPSDYYVYHSLRWLSDTPAGTQGEADVVVFHPEKGLLILEVKSGGIRCEDGIWYQKNRATGKESDMPDPAAQAERNRFHLSRKIEPFLPHGEDCLHGHCVWFTSISRKDFRCPPNFVPDIVLDKQDLQNPGAALDRVFAFWAEKKAYRHKHKLSTRGSQCVKVALAPEVDAAPSLRATIDERDEQMVRLTRDQTRVLDFLEEQSIAAICGGAGTGKTLVAWEKARRLALKGSRVLFLCYNSALKEYLRVRNASPTLKVHSFHSLAAECVGEAKTFEALEDRFLDWLTRGSTALPYEHILIDEAQDFDNDWLAALRSCLSDDGIFYVFFDRFQLVNRDEFPAWLASIPCRLVLDTNCRNTRQIARSSRAFFPDLLRRTVNAIEGPSSQLHLVDQGEKSEDKLLALVSDLVKRQEFLPQEIAVLAFANSSLKPIAAKRKLGRLPIADSITEGAVTVTTIRRFKGLEAKVVILLDVSTDVLMGANGMREYYVGSSRAMQQLHLLFSTPSEEAVAALISSISEGGDRKIRKNLKGLATFLHAAI